MTSSYNVCALTLLTAVALQLAAAELQILHDNHNLLLRTSKCDKCSFFPIELLDLFDPDKVSIKMRTPDFTAMKNECQKHTNIYSDEMSIMKSFLKRSKYRLCCPVHKRKPARLREQPA